MMIVLYIVLGLIALVIALVFLGLPILLMVTQKLDCKVIGTINDADPKDFAEIDRAFMDKTEKALEPLGFRKIGYATCDGMVLDQLEHYLVMIHEPSATFVTAEAVYDERDDSASTDREIHFSTDYDNGVQILTNNGEYITTTDVPKKEWGIEMPGTQDPVVLWRYHEARIKDEGQGMTAVPVDPSCSAAEMYTRDMIRSMKERCTTLCWKGLGEGVCTLTTLGYFLTTWSQLPPLNNIMLAKRRAAEQQIKDRHASITARVEEAAQAKTKAVYDTLAG